jgi:hypothetical protein
VRDGGLVSVDVGALVRARQLAELGFLGLAIQQPLRLNFVSAWKLLSERPPIGEPTMAGAGRRHDAARALGASRIQGGGHDRLFDNRLRALLA